MGKTNPHDLPKFHYCTNEMAEPDAEYVRHNHLPRFLARFIPDEAHPAGVTGSFQVVEEVDNIAAFFANDPLKAAGLMRRLGDWWVAYNRHLDTLHDDDL